MKYKFYLKQTTIKYCDVVAATNTELEHLTLTVSDYNVIKGDLHLVNKDEMGICIKLYDTLPKETRLNIEKDDIVTVSADGCIELEILTVEKIEKNQLPRMAMGRNSLPKINLKDYL